MPKGKEKKKQAKTTRKPQEPAGGKKSGDELSDEDLKKTVGGVYSPCIFDK
jgi:hypothetical protein